MDSEPQVPQPGPLDSARGLAANFLALLSTRAELLIVELREEGARRKEMLVFAAVAAVFLALALLLLAFFVVVLFWDTHRVVAAAAVTLVYFGVGAWAVARLRAKSRAAPPPFEATLAEFAKDLDMMKGRDE